MVRLNGGIDPGVGIGVPETKTPRNQLLPLCLTACVSLCVSPIAWSHHWVWASPALLNALVLAWRKRDRRQLWLVSSALALFIVFPASLFPRSDDVEMSWTWWQEILGSAYVWVAVALLAYYAVVGLKGRREATSIPPRPAPASERVSATPSAPSRPSASS